MPAAVCIVSGLVVGSLVVVGWVGLGELAMYVIVSNEWKKLWW